MDTNASTTVRELAEHFGFEQVVGNEASLDRLITVPNTNRPGLELTGYYAHAEPKRLVIIGNKESSFIKSMDPKMLEEGFEFLTDDETPFILVTGGNEVHPKLLEIAKKKNFPIFKTPEKSSDVMVVMVTYLDEVLAPSDNVHGVFLNVFGKGVLIIGESGMGKSEVSLELILRGHALVADDRVDFKRVKETIVGTAPHLLKGFLEIRGIGIIDTAQMFGINAYLESKELDFVVEFVKWDDQAEYLRVGIEEQTYFETMGLKIPKLIFPVKEGRNLSVLVESAVRDFMMKQKGINSSAIFDKRVIDYIEMQNKK